MAILQAIKRVIQKEEKEIETEEVALDERRKVLQKKLAQSKTACTGLSTDDKLLKGLYWSDWKVSALETPEMVQGQQFAHVRFMALVEEKNRIFLVEYQQTLYNKDKQLAEMQVVVANIKEKMARYNEWYPVILKDNPYYVNYFESRVG